MPEELPKQSANNEVLPYFEMLNTDFDNIYKICIKSREERWAVFKLCLTIYSAPLIALSALVGAKIIDPSQLALLTDIPVYIYTFTLICGLINWFVLLRFIETDETFKRTNRTINNFRLLYSDQLKVHFTQANWRLNLHVDPNYPRRKILGPSSITVATMALINASYITLGVFGFIQQSPVTFGGLFTFAILFCPQYYFFWYKEKPLRKDSETAKRVK